MSEAHTTETQRIADLELALAFALRRLEMWEPRDSLAYHEVLVAMASILCNVPSNRDECRDLLTVTEDAE